MILNAAGAKNDFAITVNTTEVLNIEILGETYPVPSWAFGQAEIVDPENPTRLMVNFEEFGVCGPQANFCGSVNPDTVETFDHQGLGNSKDHFKRKKTLNKKMYLIKDGAIFNYRVILVVYKDSLLQFCTVIKEQIKVEKWISSIS